MYGDLNLTTEEILNTTLKDVINRYEGFKSRRRRELGELEVLFICYCGYPQYATHSKKKLKINKFLENMIYHNDTRKKMSVSAVKSINDDMQILRDQGLIK